jgi:hypothetical protein
MNVYEFTLVLDREPTEAQEEAIATRAPAIVAVEGGNTALAHVAVEAEVFRDAVVDALAELEAVGLAVVGLHTDDLVSLKDIAHRTSRSYESVRLLASGQRGPGGFPPPVSHEPWSLYSWTQVAPWLTEHYPGTPFELDHQAAVADHLLRARHLASGHGSDWAPLLTA